jgi:hypothetical protein
VHAARAAARQGNNTLEILDRIDDIIGPSLRRSSTLDNDASWGSSSESIGGERLPVTVSQASVKFCEISKLNY